MTVYIASSEKHVGKIQEDIYIRDAFISKGIHAEIAVLKDIVKIAEPSDLIILKSIWGYHLDYKEFIANISELRKKKIKLVDDYVFIDWNINKYKYLEDIKTLNVIPTKLLQIKDSQLTENIINKLSTLAKFFNTNKLVIKPVISASGFLTSIYEVGNENESIIEVLQAHTNLEFLVQPYRPSISNGEISVIVINGKVLYGVVRFPGVLDTKKDTTYLELDNIPNSIKDTVTSLGSFFMRKFNVLPAICRIDFLSNNSSYEIIEVELIDPDLFFRHIPENIRDEAISSLVYPLCKNQMFIDKHVC